MCEGGETVPCVREHSLQKCLVDMRLQVLAFLFLSRRGSLWMAMCVRIFDFEAKYLRKTKEDSELVPIWNL